MQITVIKAGKIYQVNSDSGQTYTVTVTKATQHTSIYKCTCRAGQFGKVCKHQNAVREFRTEAATEQDQWLPMQKSVEMDPRWNEVLYA